jgi:hypothetical protein
VKPLRRAICTPWWTTSEPGVLFESSPVWYTICTQRTEDEYSFACHEDVLTSRSEHQDLLLKITLPETERLGMLADLYEMNISWFSLFQTEEALVRTLAYEKAERHQS